MRHLALVSMLLIGLSPLAFAQQTGKQMDETQLKQKLQSQGYSNITLSPHASGATTTDAGSGSSTPPVIVGTGMKDGKEVRFQIDSVTGEIKPVAQP